VAQQWRPTDPTHDSNAAMVLVDAKGAVYLKCLHPECVKWRYADYIDTVPPHLIAVEDGSSNQHDSLNSHTRKRRRDQEAQNAIQQQRRSNQENSSLPDSPADDSLEDDLRATTRPELRLTREQSYQRVLEENQEDDEGDLTAWHTPAPCLCGNQ
jgi:hypothetical protein